MCGPILPPAGRVESTRRRRIRGGAFILGGALGLLAGLASPGRAELDPQWFFFDRAVWSADSRTVAVVGRYVNLSSRETFEDTLLVDVATALPTCVSPSMSELSLSRDRRRLAGRGRWGIYDHELSTGTTRELIPQDPFSPGQIVSFAYTKEADALVTIRCDNSEPELSGVYRHPIDGSPATHIFPDPECGPASLNFWQVQRREVTPGAANVPTSSRPTTIPGTEAQALQVDRRGRPSVVVRQAGRDTVLCEACRSEYVSWPAGGGRALLATAPEDRLDSVGPGALWLIRPDEPPLRLDERRHASIVWSDSLVAYSVVRPGRVIIVDAGAATTQPLRLSEVPDWVRATALTPAELWTIRVQDDPFPDFEAARTEALRLKSAMGATGFAVDRTAGGEGYLLSVGSWPDSAAASRNAAAVRRNRASSATGNCTVQRRPASTLQGSFDFGGLVSPDGKWRLLFRSHPHMFRPYLADEVWLEPATGGGRRKMVVRALATF